MAYDEFLVDRVKRILKEKQTTFITKKMFGGLCFMINDKMCLGVDIDKTTGISRIMGRIGENVYEQALLKKGCSEFNITGRAMKGFVFVEADVIDMQEELVYWVQLCLNYNPLAKKVNKMKVNKIKPFDFINKIENETRKNDGIQLMNIMSQISKQEPVIWGTSIIGYGEYIQVYETGRKTKLPLMAYSPRKQHLVLYVLNNFKGQQEFLNKLGKHRTGKICLYINKLSDVNLEILKQIIKSSYNKFKLKSNT